MAGSIFYPQLSIMALETVASPLSERLPRLGLDNVHLKVVEVSTTSHPEPELDPLDKCKGVTSLNSLSNSTDLAAKTRGSDENNRDTNGLSKAKRFVIWVSTFVEPLARRF